MGKNITDQQLKSVVQEVREKIQEYNNKLESLNTEEQRIHIAQEALKKDIDKLQELQVELAATVSKLKSEREAFLKEKVKIAAAEKNNLMSIAATYDKMDAASAGKILSSMSQIQNAAARSASVEDAVKILHYMTERTKAKVLAELSTSEPKLAASLCQKLKQILEE
jgi:peptidoglycan hydrolase CwlO-like protein